MNFYKLGQNQAMEELGLPPEEDAIAEEELAAMQAQEQEGGALAQPGIQLFDAEDFVDAIEQDDTAAALEEEPEEHPPGGIEEKKPRWGGATSLEGGDAGTRNHEMGLPTAGAV